MAASVDPDEVLLEFRRIGAAVKVTAVDPRTLVEVSIVGPAAAGEPVLTRNAIAKLDRALERRRREAETRRPASPGGGAGERRAGTLDRRA